MPDEERFKKEDRPKYTSTLKPQASLVDSNSVFTLSVSQGQSMSGVGHVPASMKGYQIQKEDSEIRENVTNND
jgi:hypothetical protein